MKPVSLKEKEPTISDIGKPIYFFNDELIITDIVSAGIWTKGKQRVVDKMYFEWCFWQPVELVSSDYLRGLENGNVNLKQCLEEAINKNKRGDEYFEMKAKIAKLEKDNQDMMSARQTSFIRCKCGHLKESGLVCFNCEPKEAVKEGV